MSQTATNHLLTGYLKAACGQMLTPADQGVTNPYVVTCRKCLRKRAFRTATAKYDAEQEWLRTHPQPPSSHDVSECG